MSDSHPVHCQISNCRERDRLEQMQGMCRHEHLRANLLCPRHVQVGLWCGVCWRIDGHLCDLLLRPAPAGCLP